MWNEKIILCMFILNGKIVKQPKSESKEVILSVKLPIILKFNTEVEIRNLP